MTNRRDWAEMHQREWEAALATLREAGWQAHMTCPAAPVQIEGMLPCGEQFYFRSRHDEILLAVGGQDPSGAAPWEPGLRLMLSLAAQHQSSCQHPGSNPDG
jgi:hypothetical protein